jgi:VWFA-related protein
MAAILAAPLALGVRAQNAPAQEAAPPQPSPQQPVQGAPAQPEQTPIFRSDINFVRVDVIVNDKQGNPVADLKQEDFEVTEDGKPQAIQTFKLVKVNEDAGVGSDPPREVRNAIEEQAEAARDDVRLFAIFLDDYHVRLENSMRARELIAQFVENQLQPADMAGIMYPLFSINDVLLTRNRRNVATAIRGFQGRKYDYTPRNQFEENYVHYVSTIEAERIRNDVTLTALKGLIIRLGGLREGRKAIILVTEGFTNVLPAQVNDMIATCNGGPCMNQPRPRPDPISPNSPAQQRLESQEFFLQTDLLGDIRRVTELANRYNTAIYTIDPRGLAPFEFDLSTAGGAAVSLTKDQQMLNSTIDTLRILAENTDGRAIVNTNDLATGMRQIVRDQSAYYLLGYTSTLNQPDGKFHKINVRVKRPGVQVRARPGYLAMTAAEVERAVAPKKVGPPPAITEALGTLAVTAQQRRSLTRTWVGMSPGSKPGWTKISFVWSPTPATPGVRRETASKVSLLAGGANSDLYFRRKGIDPGRVEFEVPPGEVDLEIATEDATGEVLDRETRKLNVPSLGLGLTISTPQVFRGRTLPEWQKLALDEAAVPVIEREFRRTDRLLVRIGAQSAAGTPVITARMLNREGGEMSTLPVQAAGFGGFSHIDVPLAGLPAGEFLIEVIAKDGTEQTSSYVAIRVTP